MWGKLNLPMFLFNVGLLTLMNMDSLIFLAKHMSLIPYYLEVIMTGGVACMVTVLMNGWGVLQVLFVSFTKGPGGFPYVFIITREVTTLETIYGPTFADHRVFVPGGDQ